MWGLCAHVLFCVLQGCRLQGLRFRLQGGQGQFAQRGGNAVLLHFGTQNSLRLSSASVCNERNLGYFRRSNAQKGPKCCKLQHGMLQRPPPHPPLPMQPKYIHIHLVGPGAGGGPEVDFPMVFLGWDGLSGRRAAARRPEGPSQPRKAIGKSTSGPPPAPGPTRCIGIYFGCVGCTLDGLLLHR